MNAYREFHFDRSETIESHAYLLDAVRKAAGPTGTGAKVVDLGCGNGDLLAALKRADWQAYGVDLSTSGIAEARRKHSGIAFHQQMFDDTLVRELGESSFDLVLSTEVIEHLYVPREICDIAYKLLKPGGMFVVSTPYHGYFKNCALALTGALDRHFTVLTDCGHIKFWSYRTLGTLFREAGFVELTFRGAGRVPWLWKSMVVSGKRPIER